MTSVVVAFHVLLGFLQGWFHFGKGLFHSLFELINWLHVWRVLVWFEAHVGMSVCVQHEWGLACGWMDMVVILELSHGQEIIPIILPFIHKEAKALLQFLVDLFGLAIRLWVIGSRGCNPNA